MHQETSFTVQAIAGSRTSTSGEDKPAGFEAKQIEDVDGDLALQAQGHDLVMERQFSWVAALGLAFSITNSWVGYLVSKPLDGIMEPHNLMIKTELFRTEPQIFWTTVLHIWAHCCVRGAMDRYYWS